MGISFSCPFASYVDLESSFQSMIVKSISFGDDGAKTPVRSISFKGQDSEPTISQSIGSGKMLIEGSVSFKSSDIETMISVKAPSSNEMEPCCDDRIHLDDQSPSSNRVTEKSMKLPILDASNPKHEAAIKLQKVYKSFRTRRKLADCAVLIEQSWWKLLDFAELKRSSISFFEIEKHETAISRWSRARTRAAKVGKGLSKNGKAQKLALQHWLEAIDPRHRYGHNLQFYYVKWLHSHCKEPFFYWLDIGEGKEVNLLDVCPRSKLHQQCIKYLGPMEREAYEVVVEDGKLLYKQTRELLDTSGPMDVKWIFVLSTSMTLYVGKKKKGTFQHSSFLAGGATSAAGRLVVENGILKAVWPHSGHYQPTPENFQDFISFLRGNNVDLTNVKMDPVDEEDSIGKQSSVFLRSSSSEEDLTDKDQMETEEIDVKGLTSEKTISTEEETAAVLEPSLSRLSSCLSRKLTNLKIPKRGDLFETLESENRAVESSIDRFTVEPSLDGSVSVEDSYSPKQVHVIQNQNSSDEEDEETKEETSSEESILQRINSHKGLKSYQLGKQLSSKWTTGAGPRIGCLSYYPLELQSRALEQVNLSPRSASFLSSNLSPRVPALTSCGGEMLSATGSPTAEKTNLAQRILRHRGLPSSPLCKGTLVTAVTL